MGTSTNCFVTSTNCSSTRTKMLFLGTAAKAFSCFDMRDEKVTCARVDRREQSECHKLLGTRISSMICDTKNTIFHELWQQVRNAFCLPPCFLCLPDSELIMWAIRILKQFLSSLDEISTVMRAGVVGFVLFGTVQLADGKPRKTRDTTGKNLSVQQEKFTKFPRSIHAKEMFLVK